MIKDIINYWTEYCVEDNFVGIGSTRKVYNVSDFVIKVHSHPIGFNQSQNEKRIYSYMVKKGLQDMFAETFYVDQQISIQRYYRQLELVDNQSFDIDQQKHAKLIPRRYHEVIEILDTKWDTFDLKDSSNYGLNQWNELVFIDYGMTKHLYETEWVPLAESGVLPQIDFDYCNVCGEEKELRMYGEKDRDRRCYDCGKE